MERKLLRIPTGGRLSSWLFTQHGRGNILGTTSFPGCLSSASLDKEAEEREREREPVTRLNLGLPRTNRDSGRVGAGI